jgi:hypothetical protein
MDQAAGKNERDIAVQTKQRVVDCYPGVSDFNRTNTRNRFAV